MIFRAPKAGYGIGVNYTNQSSGGSRMIHGRQCVASGTKDGARRGGGV